MDLSAEGCAAHALLGSDDGARMAGAELVEAANEGPAPALPIHCCITGTFDKKADRRRRSGPCDQVPDSGSAG